MSKVVIDIPEKGFDVDIADKFQDYFRRVKADISYGGMCGNYEIEITDMFLAAFKRLKVLPKGHGRLIDADALNFNADYNEPLISKFDFDQAPTIIEKDGD